MALPVILFHHVVFLLAGSVLDVRAELVGDGLGIAGVSVSGDLLGLDLGDRPGEAEERLGRGHIAGFAEIDVDQTVVAVDCPVQIAPCAGDLDVRLHRHASTGRPCRPGAYAGPRPAAAPAWLPSREPPRG